MIDLDLFRTVVAPEYATFSETIIQKISEEAEKEISEERFNSLYPRALCLLTAHLIFMMKLNPDTPGNLKSAKVGAKSTNWDVPYPMTRLSSSKYGVEFRRVTYTIPHSPVFVS